MMNKFSKHPLLTGTIALTLAGLLSRVLGFFYRIFLSRTIGAEGLGVYQLIFPVFAMTFSLTAAGIQTSISKFTAEAVAFGRAESTAVRSRPARVADPERRVARGYMGNGAKHSLPIPSKSNGSKFKSLHKTAVTNPAPLTYLYAGLFLSIFLSILCSFFLYRYAEFLAVNILDEIRCTPLLKIMALSVPLGAIHSCINGYHYGLQKTTIPALSQLLEQLARVAGVYILYQIAMSQNQPIKIELAVWGLFIGELFSVLFSASFTRFRKSRLHVRHAFRGILSMSAPLTANRVLINVMQSAEAILIPGKLRAFGFSPEEALSIFGILAGMAMPIIFFPSALSNSVSVMLLPAIAEAKAKGDQDYIKSAVKKSCFYCLTLGFACTLFFLFFGKWLGVTIFANEFAGTLIMTLGWICPFLYMTTTLSSILNGLGKTSLTFLMNLLATGIRILFVFFLVPVYGINACLWGMLVSDLVVAAVAVGILWKIVWK